MSDEWTCSRCSTVNVAERFGCSNCGLLRHDIATVGSSVQAASPASPTEQPAKPAPGDPRLAFTPNVPAEDTWADFVAGRDPVLEAALKP